METEINDIEASKDTFAPLKQVTPVSKYLALLLFIMMPFIGGFIGYTYAPEKIVEVVKTVEVTKSDEAESNNPVLITDVEQIPSCELDGLTNVIEDTSDWVTSTGTNNLFFTTIHPITVSINQTPMEDNKKTFTITDSTTGYVADISAYELTDGNEFGGMNYSKYKYEMFSKTFWQRFGPHSPKQCSLGDTNHIKNDDYAFVMPNGDSGMLWRDFYVILQPTEEAYEEYDCNRSVAVSISYGADGNAPDYKSEQFEKFGAIIETMIANMNIQPACQG